MVCIKSIALLVAAAASASASSLRGQRNLQKTVAPTTAKPTLVPTAGNPIYQLHLLSLAALPLWSFFAS
jgi:hypothetical protein